MSIELVMLSNHLIRCLPLFLLPLVFPSIRAFSNELALHIRWPKYWSFSFSISPSNEFSRLISFRIDWFDLLAVQRALRSLLQHHSLKASVLHSGGQIIGASASASVLPENIQDWFPIGLTSLISLLSKGLSRVFSIQHHSFKALILQFSAFFMVNSHIHTWLLEKP